jgi:hypothetical protein
LQTQSWTKTNYSASNQFVLTTVQQSPADPTRRVTFTPITISNQSSVSLSETGGAAFFKGTFRIDKTVTGLSFAFNVSQPGAGDVLQIFVDSNPQPYFQASLANANTVAGTGAEYATIDLGYEAPLIYGTNPVTLTMVLRAPPGSSKAAQVTLNSFNTFTLPT